MLAYQCHPFHSNIWRAGACFERAQHKHTHRKFARCECIRKTLHHVAISIPFIIQSKQEQTILYPCSAGWLTVCGCAVAFTDVDSCSQQFAFAPDLSIGSTAAWRKNVERVKCDRFFSPLFIFIVQRKWN